MVTGNQKMNPGLFFKPEKAVHYADVRTVPVPIDLKVRT
jgi:hypothetical protein